MPLLQWGAVSQTYNDLVEARAAEAAIRAKGSRAGRHVHWQTIVIGANTIAPVGCGRRQGVHQESDDQERWLDTMLHALYFQREPPKRSLVWYQFSAHPVCYADSKAGRTGRARRQQNGSAR